MSSFNTIPEEITPATKVINSLWKDEKYSAVVKALDGDLLIPEEGSAVHPSTSITIIPESKAVVVKNEPTEEPVSIPETQTSELNEVTSIPETQISSVNEDSSRKPEKEIVTIKQEPTSANNKTKGNQAVTEVIVITDSSDDTDDTIEELNTLVNKSPATIGKGRPLDMTLYKDFIPEVFDKIPHNIDGLHHYMIDCREDENSLDWQKRYRDGRYFHLNSSRRKGFRGIRRIGHCKGNHICLNNECSYYLEKYQRNQHQFRSTGDSKFCFSCDCLASNIKCGAIKLIEFDQQFYHQQVYHHGKHQCHVKPNIYENDDYINKALEESVCAMGPRQLAFAQMTKEMTRQQTTGEINMMAIVNIATHLTDSKRIADLKKQISNEVKSERHSLSSVAELKTCTDTVDNFYISSINDSNINGRPSYVFKTSRKMARMAINMDHDYPHKNPSHQEPAYFDGMYKKCTGWKTLTLWAYHNASRKLLRLATMEVKGETSENVVLFWRLFNEVLAEVKGNLVTNSIHVGG